MRAALPVWPRGPERIYALRVKGDSMIDEHICDATLR